MKLKKRTLAILSILLLMPPICAQESKNVSANSQQMRIEPSATYSGEIVLQIVAVIKESARKEIEEAFEDGYKQGLLEFAPENESLKTLNAAVEKELQNYKNKYYRNIFLSGAGGIAAGFVTGFLFSVAK